MTARSTKSASLQRVLAVAAERFTSRRFEEVSISEIAMSAHCSNNTIYDAFCTKEGLYAAAIQHNARKLTVPELVTDDTAHPLDALVERLRAWFEFATDTVTCEMFLTLARSQEPQTWMSSEETDPHDHWNAVKSNVARAVDKGFLRDLDSDVLVEHIVSCVVFLPLTSRAVWGERYKLARDRQIAVALDPLFTEAGRAHFEATVGERPVPIVLSSERGIAGSGLFDPALSHRTQ